jgi:hypothetical protein
MFCFLIAMAPGVGLAQPITESFEELSRETIKEFWRGNQPVVKEGDTIWITYLPADQTEPLKQEGRVIDLTESKITMMVGDAEIELPESRVSRIEWRRKERVWNGLVIGGVAGVGVGLVMAAAVCEGGLFGADCETGNVYGALAGIGGAIGSGLGVLADRSKKSPPLLIYRAPDSSGTSIEVSLAPLVSKKRKGLVVSVTW